MDILKSCQRVLMKCSGSSGKLPRLKTVKLSVLGLSTIYQLLCCFSFPLHGKGMTTAVLATITVFITVLFKMHVKLVRW